MIFFVFQNQTNSIMQKQFISVTDIYHSFTPNKLTREITSLLTITTINLRGKIKTNPGLLELISAAIPIAFAGPLSLNRVR